MKVVVGSVTFSSEMSSMIREMKSKHTHGGVGDVYVRNGISRLRKVSSNLNSERTHARTEGPNPTDLKQDHESTHGYARSKDKFDDPIS